MSRIASPPRIVLCLMMIFALSACGGALPAATEPIQVAPLETEPFAEAPGATEPLTEEPAATEAAPEETAAVEPTQQVLPTIDVAPPPIVTTVQPAIPERRRLTLEFPPEIRAGDSDRVRLTLEVDELGNLTPTAEVAGNVVTGEVIEIPNLYETHAVIAEARFDIAGLRVSPPDLVGQSLAQGQSVTFSWSILPEGVGTYRGTIWLYLRFVDRVSGEESRKAVSAQPVEIEAVNFLSLSVTPARVVGVFGSILGTVLGFPFLEDIVKFFFKKRVQTKK